jgi:hypothetical protein
LRALPMLYSCHGVLPGGAIPLGVSAVWLPGCNRWPGFGYGEMRSMTRREETRQLLARLSELAQDETLSEQDATEMVAGLVGALHRMRENPAWQRVMATAGKRSSRWPSWLTARHAPPHDPDTPPNLVF